MPEAGNIGAQERDELHQHLVDQQNEKQRESLRAINKYKSRHPHRERDINSCEQPLDSQQVREIFR